MFKIVTADTRRSLGLPLYTDRSAAVAVARQLGAVIIVIRGR